MGVLLRWLLFFPDFGLREALSVTFAPSFAGFRAQRRVLCYLCLSFFRISGLERRSLLPLHLLLLDFGLRDTFSVTFATPFSAFRAQKHSLYSLPILFFLKKRGRLSLFLSHSRTINLIILSIIIQNNSNDCFRLAYNAFLIFFGSFSSKQ